MLSSATYILCNKKFYNKKIPDYLLLTWFN